jgi:hypothetical protein
MGLFSGIYGLMAGGANLWYGPDETPVDDPANDEALTKAVEKKLNDTKQNVPKSTVQQPCKLRGKKQGGANTPANKPNDKRCNFSGLKITKDDRKYTLLVERDTPADERKICIIAGFKNKPAKVTAELTDFFGPHQCAHVNKKSFNTGSATPKKYPGNSDHKLVIGLTSPTKIKIFPWGYTPYKFPISASRCSHPAEKAIVEVYPDTEAEVTIAYDFGERKTGSDTKTKIETNRLPDQASKPKMRNATQTDTAVTKTEREAGLSLEGSIKYDGQNYKIETAFKSTITTIKKVEKVVTQAVKTIKAIKKDIADASIEDVFESPISFGIKLPKIAFGISGKWEEEEGEPDVTYKGGIKVAADPFIGLKFEWNITDTILQTIPAGAGAKKIIKAMEISLLDLVLSASGEIAGEVELEIAGWKVENVSGKIQGKIPITAELTAIKFKRNIIIIHLSAEVKGGIEGGFFGEIGYDKSENAIQGKAGMLNMVIWYSLSVIPGVAEEDSDENTAATGAAEPVEGDTETGEMEFDYAGKNILYEWEFEDDAIDIFTYKLKDQ